MNKMWANRIQDYSWFALMVSLLFLFVGGYVYGFNKLVFAIGFFASLIGLFVSFIIYVAIYIYRHKKGYLHEKYL